MNMHPEQRTCWLCGSADLKALRPGINPAQLTPEHFAITDAHYGLTLAVSQCCECGFRFCPDAPEVTAYYESVQDEEYERTRPQRALQARKLLQTIASIKPVGTLLDVGAGSGILVEEAQKAGFTACGVEPCTWLAAQAHKRGLPVIEGTLEKLEANEQYDVITLIDVVEHVTSPVALLQVVRRHLAPDGVVVVVTPDVSSLAARLLGWRWWHYRVAHVGYFSRRTLLVALQNAGLKAMHTKRPCWFFPLDYLLLRLGYYLPPLRRLAEMKFAKRMVVPLNLFDSLLLIAKKAP